MIAILWLGIGIALYGVGFLIAMIGSDDPTEAGRAAYGYTTGIAIGLMFMILFAHWHGF